MATTVFNLSAVDRIEADVKADAVTLQSLADAIGMLTKIITDLITELGGGDQPSIDAATTALQTLSANLSAAVARDKDT